METRFSVAVNRLGISTLLVITAAFSGFSCSRLTKATAAKPTPPATVAQIPKEGELNVITLTPEAETRLGITVTAVEKRPVQRKRTFGGEIIIPPGKAVTVATPFAGKLKAADGAPIDPMNVKKGQAIYILVALLTPEAQTSLANSRVEAEGQVKNATVQLDAARIILHRAKQLLSDKAGSLRGVDEAQAQYDLAEKTLEAARAKKVLFEEEASKLTTIAIHSPEDGCIRSFFAVAGQTVPSGASLFEVINAKRIWVRVPVYSGDVKDIAVKESADVVALGTKASPAPRVATPVPAPPAGNATAGTVDLFYELDNQAGGFRPGEKVAVTLSLNADESNLVIPRSAMIHDYLGGTWVYENIGKHAYSRRRVKLQYVVGAHAVLSEGPKPGTKLVSAGAAELFGTEFGFGTKAVTETDED